VSTFYDNNRGVAINEEWLVVYGKRFAIGGLSHLRRARGPRFSGRRWSGDYQLWADYQGRPTLLFSTVHRQEFGQVSRALIRAVERAYA
jgi:Family of unknown function (DUF6232)